MSLNRNKSEEILFQLDLKVFPVNITRGQERENWQLIFHANENYKETAFKDTGRLQSRWGTKCG